MKSKTIITVVVIILVVLIGAFLFIQANSHNTKVDVISNSTLKNGDKVQIESLLMSIEIFILEKRFKLKF